MTENFNLGEEECWMTVDWPANNIWREFIIREASKHIQNRKKRVKFKRRLRRRTWAEAFEREFPGKKPLSVTFSPEHKGDMRINLK